MASEKLTCHKCYIALNYSTVYKAYVIRHSIMGLLHGSVYDNLSRAYLCLQEAKPIAAIQCRSLLDHWDDSTDVIYKSSIIGVIHCGNHRIKNGTISLRRCTSVRML